jgi:hypothetical protein
MTRVLAVDWSGAARGAERSIWLAEASRGQLVSLECGRTRDQLIDRVIEIARGDSETVVGFDFAFSFPRWWCEARAWTQGRDVWSAMAEEGEQILSLCEPPFWGRPGKKMPDHDGRRKTEREGRVGSAKSVFQIGGAGAVGTGSIRGMPFLLRLADAGFKVWPFYPGEWPRVVEIYPRELTGKVNKSSQAARLAYLRAAYPELEVDAFAAAGNSEDAFDAAVSALVMDRSFNELAALEQTADSYYAIEGAIWRPAGRDPGPGDPIGRRSGGCRARHWLRSNARGAVLQPRRRRAAGHVRDSARASLEGGRSSGRKGGGHHSATRRLLFGPNRVQDTRADDAQRQMGSGQPHQADARRDGGCVRPQVVEGRGAAERRQGRASGCVEAHGVARGARRREDRGLACLGSGRGANRGAI